MSYVAAAKESASTGIAIIATTRSVRPLARRASRRAIRSATSQDFIGRRHRCQEIFGLAQRTGGVDDDTVAQEHHAVGPAGVAGLVRDQHAGRPRVDPCPQQSQHRLAGLRVESAGRLIGEHQPAVADQSAGDSYALLLTAGHLVREAAEQSANPTSASAATAILRARRTLMPSSSSGRATFSAGGEAGQQVQVLENVTDTASPHAGSSRRSRSPTPPSTTTSPLVGRSRPPARLSRVDLPEPDGPITATSSPGATVRLTPSQGLHRDLAGAVRAVHMVKF